MSWLDELFFPRRCPVCQDIASPWGEGICDTCRKKLRPVAEKGCMKCGRLLLEGEKEYCADCSRKKRSITRGLTGYDYRQEWVRSMILEVKYHNARQLLDYPCRVAAQAYSEIISSWQCDCLIPVPLHPSRRRKRGFNQAQEIAVRMGCEWQFPTDSKVLFRVKKTLPQKNLDSVSRQTNLMEAFQVDPIRARLYERVILVDDIYTTGSTMEACAKTLLEAGVQKVYAFALAAGRDDKPV